MCEFVKAVSVNKYKDDINDILEKPLVKYMVHAWCLAKEIKLLF